MRTSKYGARKTFYGGAKYDSKKEAKRAAELELLQRAGEISNLQRQVKFELQPAFEYKGKKIRKIEYVADFVYLLAVDKIGARRVIIEDVKGYRTSEYKIKAKMMKRLIALGKIEADEFVES